MHRILIVDDEKVVRIALKTMLKWEDYGYEIVGTAGDGIEAIPMIEKYKPDVIITDLKMPNMDGIQLIRWLKEKNSKGKIIVLSNYDDFDFVKQALLLGAADYILKISLNQDMLGELLQNLSKQISAERESDDAYIRERMEYSQSKALLRNNFFKELFKEEKHDDKLIFSKAAGIGLPHEIEPSLIYYIYICGHEELIENLSSEEMERLNVSIINTIEENIRETQNVEFVAMDSKRLVVIIPCRFIEALAENSFAFGESISNTINTYLNIKVDIIISDAFSDFSGAKCMYEKCHLAEQLHFYGERINIIAVNEVKFKHQAINTEYKKAFDTVARLFEIDSSDEVLNEFDKMFSFSKQNYIPPSELKKSMLRIMDDLERFAYGDYQFDNTEMEDCKKNIALSETYDDCRGILSEYLSGIYYIYNMKKGKKLKKEIMIIIEYLNNHLEEKLTLDMISAHVNMNGSYLCRMFKKETGDSIFNYLNNIRIDKAKELLKSKDYSIKELSLSVGMEDQFYFNRVFKKKIGISPTGFRKKYFENKNNS